MLNTLVQKMKQLDMFEELKPKIYESPDEGKTIYVRNLGETEKILLNEVEFKTSVQQQWNIVVLKN